MNVRRKNLPTGRVVAAVWLGLAIAGVTRGEPIRFSKPFIALATPAKPPGKLSEPRAEDREFFKTEMDQPHISKPLIGVAAPAKVSDQLPAPREKGLDFFAPEMAPPTVVPWTQQQPMRRIEPRDEPRDDTPWMLRNPKIFTDPNEAKPGQKTTANTPGRDATRPPWSADASGRPRADSSRALSPVTDFDWDAHDSRSRPKDSTWDGKSTTRDRSDMRTRSPFGTREDFKTQRDGSPPNGMSDLSGSRSKEKLSAARLQRDADFQQLLNPNAGAAARTPNSLEPVVSAASATPSTLAMPIIGGTRLSTPGEPMTGFNPQREQPRSPIYEGYDKKNSPPSAPAPTPSFIDPRYQPPLNRQPAVHEFPTRKF